MSNAMLHYVYSGTSLKVHPSPMM